MDEFVDMDSIRYIIIFNYYQASHQILYLHEGIPALAQGLAKAICRVKIRVSTKED